MSQNLPANQSPNKMDTLKARFRGMLPSIQELASKYVTPERMMNLTLAAISRNPKIAECSMESLLHCFIKASECGLEPNTELKLAYIIPRFNGQTRQMEATYEPSYRGLVAVARRSGAIASIEAHTVYEKDEFSFAYGSNKHLTHTPTIKGRGEMAAVYAYVQFKDKTTKDQFDVMPLEDVESIRMRSKSPDNGPWKTDYAEMAKKTVLKRICKMLPTAYDSPDLAKAIEIDNEQYAGPTEEDRVESGKAFVKKITSEMDKAADDARANTALEKLAVVVEIHGLQNVADALAMSATSLSTVLEGNSDYDTETVYDMIDVIKDKFPSENEPPKKRGRPAKSPLPESGAGKTTSQVVASQPDDQPKAPAPGSPTSQPNGVTKTIQALMMSAANDQVKEKLRDLGQRILNPGDAAYIAQGVDLANKKGDFSKLDELIAAREQIPF